MNKLIFTIVVLLVANASFSQSPFFTFKEDGSTEFVVYNADKMTANQIYAKTLAWVSESYKNPDAVIKAKTENEMIRINGFMKDAFVRQLSTSTAGYDCSYTLVIEFQNGKFRAKFDVNEITVDGSKVYFSLADVIGNVKDKNGRGFDGSATTFDESVNQLLHSLYLYITKPKQSW